MSDPIPSTPPSATAASKSLGDKVGEAIDAVTANWGKILTLVTLIAASGGAITVNHKTASEAAQKVEAIDTGRSWVTTNMLEMNGLIWSHWQEITNRLDKLEKGKP
jgi:hypothetical protein